MPQCQQHTSDGAKKEEKWKEGKKDVCEREKEGGLSSLQCLNDKIGGKPGIGSIQFAVGARVSGEKIFFLVSAVLFLGGWDLDLRCGIG